MRTAIVYESMFGNTQEFAHQIRDAINEQGGEALATDVRRIRPTDLTGCDLLIVGAPTHAFSLSRQSTRDDAVRQGAGATHAMVGVREWLTTLDRAFPSRSDRPAVAVFDTRVEKVRHLPGSAARRAARALRAQGFDVIDRPTSFYVEDLKGPPGTGEVERAGTWAARVSGLATDRAGSHRRGTSS